MNEGFLKIGQLFTSLNFGWSKRGKFRQDGFQILRESTDYTEEPSILVVLDNSFAYLGERSVVKR
jgi:hypothetical protein